ncbi:MAG: response regulator [Proteobacteria bacterium]|nr:response regulator [Pseudomonadota bacterium]
MAKKIMVVDDDPAIVRYLTSLFENNGYVTCSATDGSKAFSVFESEEPDLITLDLEMPEEWGPQFYRKLMKKKRRKVPVIVISGLSSNKYSIADAAAIISKPFDANQVLAAVKQVIG